MELSRIQRPQGSVEGRGKAVLAAATVFLGLAVCCDRRGPATEGKAGAPENASSSSGSGPSREGSAFYTCPMHPAVLERAPGKCPDCGMALEAAAAVAYLCLEHPEEIDVEPGACRRCKKPLQAAPTRTVWTCPSHSGIVSGKPGECPVCSRRLQAGRRALTWSCAEHGGAVALRPGTCPHCGKPLGEVLRELPHGDHTPKHGGLFFMAPDRWHHVEGVLVAPDTFRLYVYDNFTRPLDARGFTGELLLSQEGPDGVLRDDPPPVPLRPNSGGRFLEARSPRFRLPFYARARVELGGETFDFDFAFAKPSSPQAETKAAASNAGEARALEIPERPQAIVAEARIRALQAALLIEEGRLAEVYVPAFEAKDLALALLEREGAARRLEPAVRDVVRGAWLLDHFGDLGERRGVLEGYRIFARGLEALARLYPLSVEAGALSPAGPSPAAAESPAARGGTAGDAGRGQEPAPVSPDGEAKRRK